MIRHDPRLVAPCFDLEAAIRAGEEWGANCGPAALVLVAGMTLEEIRPHLGDFEQKHYTNPTLMFAALRRLGLCWQCEQSSELQGMLAWPEFGLARVQWEGPWTAPGVPIRVRYRHTHWVASMAIEGEEQNIFDVNCMCVGGWVPLSEWAGSVVPWLLKECEPKANGRWHLTHAIHISKPCAVSAPVAQPDSLLGRETSSPSTHSQESDTESSTPARQACSTEKQALS